MIRYVCNDRYCVLESDIRNPTRLIPRTQSGKVTRIELAFHTPRAKLCYCVAIKVLLRKSFLAEDLVAFSPTDSSWPEYMRINCILVSYWQFIVELYNGIQFAFKEFSQALW